MNQPMHVVLPREHQWIPKEALPPGAFGTVLHGDPARGGFSLLVRFPARFEVPSHTHSARLRVFMVSGALSIVTADRDVEIGAGGYFELPAGLVYVARCTEPCRFIVYGDDGFDLLYADPANDPRRTLARAG